jgi:hypothetical protein
MRTCRAVLLAALSFPGIFPGAATAASPERLAPPQGIAVAPSSRAALEKGVAELGGRIVALRASSKGAADVRLRHLLPDVEVFHKAVHWALAHDEFFRTNEIDLARTLLREGLERTEQLAAGAAPWTTATGLVVRGYVSRIDGSVQPYGLVVPASFAKAPSQPHRLDVWLHGRDNHLTELKFIGDHRKSLGEFAPADTFVLHPYGRYCNAFKFAGETDVFEALEHVRQSYPIDGRRLAIRGFSMGGAGTWHLAAHHGAFWTAAAPGAGFAETAEYTRVLAREPTPAWYEQRLWRLYDATEYAVNLFHCPTLAYSGELDKQKQAADVMAGAMRAEGLELEHLVGPGVEHKYEPKAKRELARRFEEWMSRGREPWPRQVRFTTWTLRYHRMAWVTVVGLDRHWERARVEAEIVSTGLKVATTNVSELVLALAPEVARPGVERRIAIDGQTLDLESATAQAGSVRLRKDKSRWSVASPASARGLRKRHGLQGPIDDAFMDSFIMVRPTGQPWHPAVGAWVSAELAHATSEWRAQFRGDARVKEDIEVTDAEIAASHLVLWGDPQSNRLLARIAGRLPVDWSAKAVRLGDRGFPSAQHVPMFIFPNPLNPARYVVINSGFTFCELAAASNAQQTPRLPDFAVVDISTPRATRWRSGVQHAGFFGEHWEWRNP